MGHQIEIEVGRETVPGKVPGHRNPTGRDEDGDSGPRVQAVFSVP